MVCAFSVGLELEKDLVPKYVFFVAFHWEIVMKVIICL